MHPLEVYCIDRDHLARKNWPDSSYWFEGTVGMSKEEFKQRWIGKSLRKMLSEVEERVGKLEGSMEDINESLDGVEDRIDNWKEQSRDYVKMSFDSTMDKEEAQAKLQGITQRGTVGEFVQEFKELMPQASDVTEKEVLLAFQNGLKPWVRQKMEQRGLQKLSEAMTVGESVVKLGLGKDKVGSSKLEERGVHEKDHKEDIDGNGIGDNCGNGKP
ncbi:hypothetical protein Gotri_010543 [Gossypium trilobum]|uniref:Retrotransposon gag domain-containing protein n=1 Tax=Gossypium trilobum TaxID=34281 RepID=A0A7J9EQS2_9ROSI|nr:hypothetical protein [Gossypium trilobum]